MCIFADTKPLAMNRKKFFLLCVSTLASLCVLAQVQYADPYLSDDARPNASLWLPEPPSQLSGEFYNDYYFYVWGKSQREARGEEAVWNSTASLNEVFSESMGIAISPELTPEIWKLASGATSDAMAEKKRVKNLYQRIRPFTTFGEPSLTPETDEEEAFSSCYPSGHSVAGWMFALALSTVAPERTAEILVCAREYALDRVICGHHWKSDIDVGMMLSMGVFSNVVVSEAYQQQLVKARAEYKRIKEGTGVEAPKAANTQDAPMFHLDGTPATDVSRGIIVTQGQTVLRK